MSATTEQAARDPILTFPRRSFDTDPQWIAARADARALGLKPEAVYAFKRRHQPGLDSGGAAAVVEQRDQQAGVEMEAAGAGLHGS